MTAQKQNARHSELSDGARVIGQVDVIPLFSRVIGNLSREERVQAMDDYFSGIMLAKSAEQQAKSICLAIVTFAVHLRGTDTSWRQTLPRSIERRARHAGLGTRCHVEDIRVLCDAAIAHNRQEFDA
jgi:hypothetical protein